MMLPLSQFFFADYTAKDLILYALAVGYGQDELKYVYEHDPDFQAVPTFPLALSFWAQNHSQETNTLSHGRVQTFPPTIMRHTGLLPDSCKKTNDPFEGTVLHTWQSISWHQEIPVPQIDTQNQNNNDIPVSTSLSYRITSVLPKSIGAFVTSETEITIASTGKKLCTLQATSLLLGMSQDNITPLGISSSKPRHCTLASTSPSFEWHYQTYSTQALLYRLGSGDSNAIHVNLSATAVLGNKVMKPILHGLCTLAIATRAILKYLDQTAKLTNIECHFTSPVFVGDTLIVRLWDIPKLKSIQFQVHNHETGKMVVDGGHVEYADTRKVISCL